MASVNNTEPNTQMKSIKKIVTNVATSSLSLRTVASVIGTPGALIGGGILCLGKGLSWAGRHCETGGAALKHVSVTMRTGLRKTADDKKAKRAAEREARDAFAMQATGGALALLSIAIMAHQATGESVTADAPTPAEVVSETPTA